MGTVTVSIPLVTWRDGRPRFIPGPRLRKLGLKGEDLKHPDGRWMTFEEAIAWSKAREQLIADLESRTPRARKRVLSAHGMATLMALFEDWRRDPRMNGIEVVEGKKRRLPLKANSVRYYRNGEELLAQLDDGKIYHAPAAALTAKTLAGVIDRIEIQRGLSQARCARATLSALFTWAKGKNKISANPVAAMNDRLPTPAPRIRYGEIPEMKHLVAAADFIGYHDIGDAIVLGLWTAQRQNDRRDLIDGQIVGDRIRFLQSKKHGQPLLIPAAPELKARLAAARHRRRDWRVNYPNVILDEQRRTPFKHSWYRQKYTIVRDVAANGLLKSELEGVEVPLGKYALQRIRQQKRRELRSYPDDAWAFAPMPSLADFRDQDLRDTAVTWLALAGCDKTEIASITGHSLKSIDDILKHYLGLHPELARSAIGKLVTWYEGETGK